MAAVSGGADSVALLHALIAARDPAPAFPIILAHLNHQLRGAESDADEAFAAGTARPLDLGRSGRSHRPCALGRVDVAARRRLQARFNVEATARHARYQWLASVARETGACWVATGHTADDQAETVLHRLLRGTGLQGLRGIAARRELEPGVSVFRPLLQTTRSEILTYLAQLNQTFREDSSNRDLGYTRNRIRLELLPYLAKRYNPAAATALARLAEQADEVFREEEAAAIGLLSAAELPRAGTMLVFDQTHLAAAPRRLTRAALRFAWAREGWPLDAMDHAAWERLAAMVYGLPDALDLPGGIHARVRGQVLQIGPKGPAATTKTG